MCMYISQDTIRYELVGNERATEYYYLNPSSGLITVKKLITEGEQNDDTVRDICVLLYFRFSDFLYILL